MIKGALIKAAQREWTMEAEKRRVDSHPLKNRRGKTKTHVSPAVHVYGEIAVLVDHALGQLQEPLIGLWCPPVLQVTFGIMVTT